MSRTHRLGLFIVVGIALSLFIPTIPVQASSVTEHELINEIVRTNPGTTEHMVIESADKIAERTGKTREETLQDIVKEIRQNARYRDETLAEIRLLQTKSNANNESVQLPTSYNKGDMFLTPASTLGAEHGHIGIYGGYNWIVEAQGPGKLSRWAWNCEVVVQKGTVLMETTCTQDQQNAAADYAYFNLVDRPYNLYFWDNKNLDSYDLNCSQLVWIAYMKGAGVDLDGNGGSGVFPYDIKESTYTKVNWVVETAPDSCKRKDPYQ